MVATSTGEILPEPHCILKLTSRISQGQSYYRTLIGNHTQSIEWYRFQYSGLYLYNFMCLKCFLATISSGCVTTQVRWGNRFHYRQDAAKRQTAGIVFTHRPKIRVFAPQGRLVALIQVKLCSTDGHLGPLGCEKFHVNRCRRVGMRPQNIKNFHFLVKSRPAGATPLTDFEIVLGLLYAWLSYVSVSNFMWFASQITELLRRNRASVN